jgi:hypothetical protein
VRRSRFYARPGVHDGSTLGSPPTGVGKLRFGPPCTPINARITTKGTRKPALAGDILWPTASQPWDADGIRDSSAPVGAASGGRQAKKHGAGAVAGLVGTTTRCRPLRGSGLLLLRSFPRLARRGPHDVATTVAQTLPSALILEPMPCTPNHQPLPYSYRNATMGSTFVARRAGM